MGDASDDNVAQKIESFASFKVPKITLDLRCQALTQTEKCFVYKEKKMEIAEDLQPKDDNLINSKQSAKLRCLVVSGTDDHSDSDPPQTETYVLKIRKAGIDTADAAMTSSEDTDTCDEEPENSKTEQAMVLSSPEQSATEQFVALEHEKMEQNETECVAEQNTVEQNATEMGAEDQNLVTPPTSVQNAEIVENGNSSSKTRRSSRKRPHEVVSVTCPLCGKSLRTDELSTHVETELCRLEKMTNEKLGKSRRSCENFNRKSQGSSSTSVTEEPEVMDSTTRYKSYLTVRTRRERRSLTKKKKAPGPGEQETKCPVCNETIIGSETELAEHVEQCLVQQEEDSSAELDVEGDDGGFEEYTWAGQTRIRATSLVEGGLAASGFQTTSRSKADEDDDVDLDVDGDDCNLYGNNQYTEADLLPCRSEEPDEEKQRKALRNAVIKGDGSRVSRTVPGDRKRWSVTKQGDKRVQKNCEENGDASSPSANTEEMACLKARIRDQETQLATLERPKCLICMEWYRAPLVSVHCWHVHCEECWLRTLGTKKLCPQCNMITSPADLRKIYL